jgi:hypothetical protein
MSPSRKPRINEALTEAVRQFASPTTPEQLEHRGLRHLRHVSIEQVSAMIEKAVNRTIMERTLGGVEGDLSKLVESAQFGLLGLMKGVEDVDATRGAISRSRTQLQSELAQIRRRRVAASATPPPDPDDPTVKKMAALIHETFGKILARSPESLAVERAFTERALVLLEEMRRRTAAAQIRDREGHIDLLERRVSKLVQSLETTEEMLKRIAAMKDVDPGVASLYRVVQGLSLGESNRELKMEMMKMIFNANVALQKKQVATG